MDVKVKKIYLSLEPLMVENPDLEEESTDVIVRLENGEMYAAAFFTFEIIKNNRSKYQASGEYLHGKYFWQENMVLVETCSYDLIKEVIENIIDEGNFYNVFRNL